jgi:hypothetical protein
MANAALKVYEEEVSAGRSPYYPQWADDMLVVCERAELASYHLPAAFAYNYLSNIQSGY